MSPHRLSPEDVVEFFRAHIQQIVAEITHGMAEMPAGLDRLCHALTTYWEAGYARRAMRQLIMRAVEGTPLEPELDRIGKPFRVLVRLELQTSGLREPETAARAIFREAKSITLEEASTGNRALQRRERLLEAIRADALAGLA